MTLEINFIEIAKVAAPLITGCFTTYGIYKKTMGEKTKTSKDQYYEIINAVKERKEKPHDVHVEAELKTLLQINHGSNIDPDATEYIIDKRAFPEAFLTYKRCQYIADFDRDTGFHPIKISWCHFDYRPSKTKTRLIAGLALLLATMASASLMVSITALVYQFFEDQNQNYQAAIVFFFLFLSLFYVVYDLGKVNGKLIGIEKLMKLHDTTPTTAQRPTPSSSLDAPA